VSWRTANINRSLGKEHTTAHTESTLSSQKLRKYCAKLSEIRSNFYCTSEILLQLLRIRGKKATVKCKEVTHLKENKQNKKDYFAFWFWDYSQLHLSQKYENIINKVLFSQKTVGKAQL